jgi:mono/diheme cytochrome c family protein
VIVNGTSQLTAEDVKAMAVYLKSLPAREPEGKAVAAVDTAAGKAIYEKRCSECHQSGGDGGLFAGPPLIGSAIVQTTDPASLINVILYGPQTPKSVDYGAWETMKFYGDVLNDADVAAVATYVRNSWGNTAPPVTAAEVAAQR